jgi:hypothetical protein
VGLASSRHDEGEIIAAALGDKKTVLLAHHGLVVARTSVEAAWVLGVVFERAAKLQLMAPQLLRRRLERTSSATTGPRRSRRCDLRGVVAGHALTLAHPIDPLPAADARLQAEVQNMRKAFHQAAEKRDAQALRKLLHGRFHAYTYQRQGRRQRCPDRRRPRQRSDS